MNSISSVTLCVISICLPLANGQKHQDSRLRVGCGVRGKSAIC